MGYISAEKVLPPEVLELVQSYVSGQTIYVPRKRDAHLTWGARTGTQAGLAERNRQIYAKYQEGIMAADLADEYFLTEKSIQRIIRKYKPSKEQHK